MNHSDSLKNKRPISLGPQRSEKAGVINPQSQSQNDLTQLSREFAGQKSDIFWSGDASICSKQLKHYPAFIRNGTTIPVYSFVSIMADEQSQYIGYVEDLYENYRRQKMVKVRLFCENQESVVIPEPCPNEIMITPHVEDIRTECISGLATILTPKHYKKCLAVVSQDFSSEIYMCFRQFENNITKPFSLSNLRGYSNQSIFFVLDCSLSLKQIISNEEDDDHEDNVAWEGALGIQSSGRAVRNSVFNNPVARGPMIEDNVVSFNVNEEIEVLNLDSGMRGCWFMCKILEVSQQRLKVIYKDVESSDNLEEWVPACRIATPDKLGMRCSGRHTVRPCPPSNSLRPSLCIGSAVDTWWCGAWWEGVVVGVDVPRKNSFRIYFPGENRFQNHEKKNLRASKDWIDNKWVEIKPKPDIFSFISSNLNPTMKFKRFSNLGGSSSSGVGSTVGKRKSVTFSEENQEFPVSAATDIMKTTDLKLKKKA